MWEIVREVNIKLIEIGSNEIGNLVPHWKEAMDGIDFNIMEFSFTLEVLGQYDKFIWITIVDVNLYG